MVQRGQQKVDLFKALSHPTRREILRLIARKGAVSYKELTKLEPKAGVLYHHLRLLGDLIYQDEHRLYRLTDEGFKAIEFLDTIFLEPTEKSIHKYITPRPFLEMIEGRRLQIILISVFLLTSLIWQLQHEYVQLFIFIAPLTPKLIPAWLFPIISWILSSAILTLIIRVIYQRYCSFQDVLIKLIPGLLILNLFPIFLFLVHNIIVEIIIYFCLQMVSLLFIISAVSVSGRISLRKSALSVIPLHYLSIILYLLIKSVGLL